MSEDRPVEWSRGGRWKMFLAPAPGKDRPGDAIQAAPAVRQPKLAALEQPAKEGPRDARLPQPDPNRPRVKPSEALKLNG